MENADVMMQWQVSHIKNLQFGEKLYADLQRTCTTIVLIARVAQVFAAIYTSDGFEGSAPSAIAEHLK